MEQELFNGNMNELANPLYTYNLMNAYRLQVDES